MLLLGSWFCRKIKFNSAAPVRLAFTRLNAISAALIDMKLWLVCASASLNKITRISMLPKLCFTVLPFVRTWLIRTVLPLKQDLAYLKLTAFSRDFFALKFCFIVLPLVRTWLIHTVLPFKQDLAYMKLTVFSVIPIFQKLGLTL